MVESALAAAQAPRALRVRTCVGCRQRAPASELLRLVAVQIGSTGDGRSRLVPDPGRRMPGRGAHLHPDRACLALAHKRRAFGRALRLTGVPDTGELVEWLDPVAQVAGSQSGSTSPTVARRRVTTPAKVGRPT